jgi:PhnB protein
MFVPPGFNTVTPYFFVERAADFLDFLVEGLGGKEIGRTMDGNRIANAQVQLGTSTVMVSEASPAFPAMAGSYYLYVENADEAMAKAVDVGAAQISAIGDMPYGERQGGIRDKHGNIWWLSQRLVPGPY